MASQSALLNLCSELHLWDCKLRWGVAPLPALSVAYKYPPQWCTVCTSCLRQSVKAKDRGDILMSLVNSAAVPVANTLTEAVVPKKRGWLPLLTVLFLISYGLMTLLIVEQGQTIESQRALIRELFRDSTELSAVKAQTAAQNAKNAARVHTPAFKTPMTKNPANAPSTQAQNQQLPSSQVPQQRVRKGSPKQYEVPSRPAADLADQQRALITI